MSQSAIRYLIERGARVRWSPTFRSASPFVAFAAFEFIVGVLLDNPHRVGKRLRPPLDDRYSARRGTYRVLYGIDEHHRQVTVVGVFPRADAYRTR